MNFDSDEESTFKDPEEAAMKDHSKNEKTLLKDILIEPGTCYREQFAEILQGFPKVKKALNLNESVSMWHDSQGMSGSILENDEQAFDQTEKTILKSYNNFLLHQEISPKEAKTTSKAGSSFLGTKASVVKTMNEMTVMGSKH